MNTYTYAVFLVRYATKPGGFLWLFRRIDFTKVIYRSSKPNGLFENKLHALDFVEAYNRDASDMLAILYVQDPTNEKYFPVNA